MFWFVVLYAGADHPPPTGFLWAILLDLIAAALVFHRVPTYLAWAVSRKSRRLICSARDGVIVGLLFAAIALVLPGTGQPGVNPHLVERLLFFVALGVVGATTGMALYLLSAAASTLTPRNRVPSAEADAG